MILSIETSTPVCSVAIHQEGQLLAYQELRLERAHSSRLSLLVAQVLEHVQIGVEMLDAVAVSAGPGSYTGLRIGASTAKGLCFAHDLPLIGLGSLATMAAAVAQQSQAWAADFVLCPMLDARRMEVYTALYTADLHCLAKPRPLVVEQPQLPHVEATTKVLIFGDGAEKCTTVLAAENHIFLQGIVPSAKDMGALAWQKFKAQQFENLAYFVPSYLKAFQASTPTKAKL